MGQGRRLSDAFLFLSHQGGCWATTWAPLLPIQRVLLSGCWQLSLPWFCQTPAQDQALVRNPRSCLGPQQFQVGLRDLLPCNSILLPPLQHPPISSLPLAPKL